MDPDFSVPHGDYRFQMQFARGSVADYFAPTAENRVLLAERARWLQDRPHTYAALLPEGEPLLQETLVLAAALSTAASPAPDERADDQSPFQRCLRLGALWEPDFLLLKADSAGAVRLWGGCVCFPSSWSLEEKMGKPIEAIHASVPGLNEQIGNAIHTFLLRLKPGMAWLRTNWGLSRSPELNQHPSRGLPGLTADVAVDEVWFRVEHQALAALPKNHGILFGIRIKMHALAAIKAHTPSSRRLAQALATMPESVARYKGLATARGRLLELLG